MTPYYKASLEQGLMYQDFVVDVSLNLLGLAIMQYGSKLYQQNIGESRTGVEIKLDNNFSRTGNLWIEISEKATQRDGPYVTSGIYRNDNCWLYVIGDYDTVFFFPKTYLRALHQAGRYRVIENNRKTSEGFLIPEKDAHKYACVVLTPKASKKVSGMVSDLREQGRILAQISTANPQQLSLFPELDGGECYRPV